MRTIHSGSFTNMSIWAASSNNYWEVKDEYVYCRTVDMEMFNTRGCKVGIYPFALYINHFTKQAYITGTKKCQIDYNAYTIDHKIVVINSY